MCARMFFLFKVNDNPMDNNHLLFTHSLMSIWVTSTSWSLEVPRLRVQSELWPLAYARATATQDPSRVCNLHHSSQQRWIINPLSKARDRTRNLMVPSRIR